MHTTTMCSCSDDDQQRHVALSLSRKHIWKMSKPRSKVPDARSTLLEECVQRQLPHGLLLGRVGRLLDRLEELVQCRLPVAVLIRELDDGALGWEDSRVLPCQQLVRAHQLFDPVDKHGIARLHAQSGEVVIAERPIAAPQILHDDICLRRRKPGWARHRTSYRDPKKQRRDRDVFLNTSMHQRSIVPEHFHISLQQVCHEYLYQ